PTMVAYERPHRDIGFHFVDQVAREARSVAGIDAITANSYKVRSTISLPLQRAVEEALQEGLWRYERNAGRLQFRGPEASLARAVAKIEAERKASDRTPAWQLALANARLPLYDVHWTPAVVVENSSGKKGEGWKVGLADGRIVPLSLDGSAQKKLALYDAVFVHLGEGGGKGGGKGGEGGGKAHEGGGKGKGSARAELRVRPGVQGMVLVLENKSGRILAMTGGFSYPLSQLNRATQSVRQPGSTIKPLSYLAALGRGLQPNTLIADEPITLPPIGTGRVREQDYWTPKNYDGGAGGVVTLRRALENSRNLATVHLLEGGIEDSPEESLDRLCRLAMEAQI
ncbi:MAG TPA: penicillin-binding transpeptidase domain-containing protein, partial [Novosphingobium sp.]|nr:penicillin-binding transpeptidase domain-containing protein [Novosphingobium sp.]